MKKSTKKTLIISSSITLVLLLAIAIYFIVGTFQQSISPGGFTKTWDSAYSNNEYTFSFSGTYQASGGGDTNVRVDPNNCYEISLYREPYQSNSLPVDAPTCNILGGTLSTCMARECYKQQFCSFQSINFDSYVVKSVTTNDPQITFDMDNFKKTKMMTICNNGDTQIGSYSIKVVLSQDFDISVYEFKNNSCNQITVKKSVSTNYYDTLDNCNKNIVVPTPSPTPGPGPNPNPSPNPNPNPTPNPNPSPTPNYWIIGIVIAIVAFIIIFFLIIMLSGKKKRK